MHCVFFKIIIMHKIIYETIAVNKEMLTRLFDASDVSNSFSDRFPDNYSGIESETFPKGKIIGIKFNSFVESQKNEASFLLSKTTINIKDTRSHLVTQPTDIRDYEHKQGAYLEGFKKVDFDLETNEKIIVEWETTGQRLPICGEFIFAIEENCACPN